MDNSSSLAWPADCVDIDVSDGIATVALNRPAKRNAFNDAMVKSIIDVMSRIETEAAVRAVVIIGRGEHFSAGADIANYSAADEETFVGFTDRARSMCELIASSRCPVIAAVAGVALGGGFELVLSCDFVVATNDASFGLPELRLGLIPGWGGTQRLPAAIGPNLAREVILLGKRLDATEAQRHGMVNDLCTSNELFDRAHALAARLAGQSAAAVAAAKRAIAAPLARSRRSSGYQVELAELLGLFNSPVGKEGISAFIEKREPRF